MPPSMTHSICCCELSPGTEAALITYSNTCTNTQMLLRIDIQILSNRASTLRSLSSKSGMLCLLVSSRDTILTRLAAVHTASCILTEPLRLVSGTRTLGSHLWQRFTMIILLNMLPIPLTSTSGSIYLAPTIAPPYSIQPMIRQRYPVIKPVYGREIIMSIL
jgi:hypothetical protein